MPGIVGHHKNAGSWLLEAQGADGGGRAMHARIGLCCFQAFFQQLFWPVTLVIGLALLVVRTITGLHPQSLSLTSLTANRAECCCNSQQNCFEINAAELPRFSMYVSCRQGFSSGFKSVVVMVFNQCYCIGTNLLGSCLLEHCGFCMSVRGGQFQALSRVTIF